MFLCSFAVSALPDIYSLSLHDALPISIPSASWAGASVRATSTPPGPPRTCQRRSEEHTSELQSRGHLVCRLLLEKKKKFAEPVPPVVQAVNRMPSESRQVLRHKYDGVR